MLALIDTDPGIDDALALLYAWGSPELRVPAITTVAGNVPLPVATRNVFRLLAVRRPQPGPTVAAGAPQPLARDLVTASEYHGEDGLGDVDGWPDVTPAPDPAGAIAMMARTVREAAEPLTLIALGPLTNIALALEAGVRPARVVAMGGAVDVPGNVTETAEFNIHVDPDAAARVVASGVPVDLVPLDATRQARLTREALHAALAGRPGPLAARVAAFTERALRLDHAGGARGMALHDPLAVAAALDPTLVQWDATRLTIGPDGQTRRGRGVPNCRFAVGVDTERFLATFLERLCPAS